jgi:hypothetical protein
MELTFVTFLQMRSVLDPKRHYRANDSAKNPKFFQIATVINGPADYYAKEDGRSVRKRKRVRHQTMAMINFCYKYSWLVLRRRLWTS